MYKISHNIVITFYFNSIPCSWLSTRSCKLITAAHSAISKSKFNTKYLQEQALNPHLHWKHFAQHRRIMLWRTMQLNPMLMPQVCGIWEKDYLLIYHLFATKQRPRGLAKSSGKSESQQKGVTLRNLQAIKVPPRKANLKELKSRTVQRTRFWFTG